MTLSIGSNNLGGYRQFKVERLYMSFTLVQVNHCNGGTNRLSKNDNGLQSFSLTIYHFFPPLRLRLVGLSPQCLTWGQVSQEPWMHLQSKPSSFQNPCHQRPTWSQLSQEPWIHLESKPNSDGNQFSYYLVGLF